MSYSCGHLTSSTKSENVHIKVSPPKGQRIGGIYPWNPFILWFAGGGAGWVQHILNLVFPSGLVDRAGFSDFS